jgi:hypothetical protein
VTSLSEQQPIQVSGEQNLTDGWYWKNGTLTDIGAQISSVNDYGKVVGAT